MMREGSPIAATSPSQVAAELREFAESAQECFIVITLNTKNRIIGKHIVSLGLLDQCAVHPREVYRRAILDNSAAVIVSHNHPSGETNPSAEDSATHFEAHAWNVTAPDGTRLNIHDGRRRDEAPPSAKIARTKPQEQIARDIARRIIPLADTYAARTLEYHAARNAADVTTEATIKAIMAAFPIAWYRQTHDEKPGGYRHLSASGCHYMQAEIAPDGEVTLKVDHLPPETAAAIVRIVATLPTKS